MLVYITSAAYDSLSIAEHERLNRQLSYMNNYSIVLGERISAFNQNER